MPGRPPQELKRRTNADAFGGPQTVKADGRMRGPVLKGDFSEQTRSWYATWRRSPQSLTFTATDWQRLAMLALVVDDFFAAPTARKMAEIRQSESLLGATHMDRLRARISIDRSTAPPATVTAADAARSRLGVA
jgi:hypothetical protein